MPRLHTDILTEADLKRTVRLIGRHACHDTRLFVAMVWVGYYGQLHLSDLVGLGEPSMRDSVQRGTDESITLSLPSFARLERPRTRVVSVTLWRQSPQSLDPLFHLIKYIRRRDRLFPNEPELWLLQSGRRPDWVWFRVQWRRFFTKPCNAMSLRGWYVFACRI